MIKPDEKDYKSYSLRNLSEWIEDALQSDATVDEIYLTIVNSIKQKNRYYQACLNTGEELLRKLHVVTPPHRPTHPKFDTISEVKEFQKFWEEKDITGEGC